jgi:hypothetical protein
MPNNSESDTKQRQKITQISVRFMVFLRAGILGSLTSLPTRSQCLKAFRRLGSPMCTNLDWNRMALR